MTLGEAASLLSDLVRDAERQIVALARLSADLTFDFDDDRDLQEAAEQLQRAAVGLLIAGNNAQFALERKYQRATWLDDRRFNSSELSNQTDFRLSTLR